MTSIVHVVVTYRRGGTEQIVLDLSRLSLRDGHQVTVVIPPAPALDGLCAAAERLGARVERIGPLYERKRSVTANALALYRLFRERRPSLVHFHMPWAPLCYEAILAARLADVPYRIRTEHNPITGPLSRGQLIKLQVLDRLVQRIALVSTDNLAKHVKHGHRPREKCVVINNGVDATNIRSRVSAADRLAVRRSLGLPAERPLCVMVAALEERKGILDFVAAARVAAAANPAIDFAVLGDGPLREQAEAQVARIGLAERVHFLGHRCDVHRVLCAFDVFVQPSHHEGLSLVMLEALAAGLPMVTTRVDGVSDVLPEERGALCADVGDVSGLGEAMSRVVADEGLREELVAVSQRRVLERFTVEAMYRNYLALYRHTGVPL